MGFFDTDRWNEIWQTIRRNRKRSIMTALGVFWGIFMLTVLLGAGMGLGRLFRAQLGETSTNTVLMNTGRTSIPYKGMPTGRAWNLENDDVEAIKKLPEVKYAAGMVWANQFYASHGDRKGEYYVMGHMPDYQKINPEKLVYGRYINDLDMERKRKVCLIGTQIWKDLFPGGEDPTGKTILLQGSQFTVVGVLKRQSNMMTFSDVERTIILPATLVQQMFGMGRTIHMLAAVGHNDVPPRILERAVKAPVFARHIISPDDPRAAWVMTTAEFITKVNSLFWGIGLLTWIVGLGTLLAGIVGVSNIMLVTVTERTSEFGIRKALGAKPVSIIRLILTESVMITAMFGYIGMVLGVAVMEAVNYVINQTPAQTGNFGGSIFLNPTLDLGVAVSATVVLVIAGLIAGYVPAYRAAQLKTIDALRYNK